MKKYIVKESLVPVKQIMLDESVIDCVESINFRIDGNRITNKISRIFFKTGVKSLDLMEKLIIIFKIPTRCIIGRIPIGIDLCALNIYLVKENVLELREKVIISEEI